MKPIRVFLLTLSLSLAGIAPSAFAQASSECPAVEAFAQDADVTRVAEAYAIDAVDIARENFGTTLDWSDESISSVEQILASLHEQRANAPSEEIIWTFAKAFGSYVGEVYRRNHGGAWGMVTLNEDQFPGLQARESCALFWPWDKAHSRISNGPEDNVLHYYQALLDR